MYMLIGTHKKSGALVNLLVLPVSTFLERNFKFHRQFGWELPQNYLSFFYGFSVYEIQIEFLQYIFNTFL